MEEAEAAGWIVFKLTFLNAKGAPDRIFGRDGQTVVMELKREKGPLSQSQRRRHEDLRIGFGWTVHVVDNLAAGRRLLGLKGGNDGVRNLRKR